MSTLIDKQSEGSGQLASTVYVTLAMNEWSPESRRNWRRAGYALAAFASVLLILFIYGLWASGPTIEIPTETTLASALIDIPNS